MNFWEKVKKDLQKGIKEGIDWGKIKAELQKGIKEGMVVVKEGAAVVKGKAEEITEEGKRRYKIFELKRKVHDWMAELGGRVYELSSKMENPMQDATVKLMVARIKKIEAQITRLEGKPKVTTRKTPAKRPIKAKSKQYPNRSTED